jgi:hypothetical protein
MDNSAVEEERDPRGSAGPSVSYARRRAEEKRLRSKASGLARKSGTTLGCDDAGDHGNRGSDVQVNAKVLPAFIPVTEPQIVIWPLTEKVLPLDTLQPVFLIALDMSLDALRQVEVYKAQRPGRPVRLYNMVFGESVDEQNLLRSAGNYVPPHICLTSACFYHISFGQRHQKRDGSL